jgi:hypothetical protein
MGGDGVESSRRFSELAVHDNRQVRTESECAAIVQPKQGRLRAVVSSFME